MQKFVLQCSEPRTPRGYRQLVRDFEKFLCSPTVCCALPAGTSLTVVDFAPALVVGPHHHAEEDDLDDGGD